MVMKTAAERDGHDDNGNGQNDTHLPVPPDFTGSQPHGGRAGGVRVKMSFLAFFHGLTSITSG
jgi:hypothetical protein